MTAYNIPDITAAPYNVPTDGTTAIDTAWGSYLDFLATLSPGDSVTLGVPAYPYRSAGSGVGGTGYRGSLAIGALGGTSVTMNIAAGASFTGDFYLGQWRALFDDDTHSAYVETANVGATSVTLKTGTDVSRFAVGRWIAITCVDLQGFGSPPNPRLYENRKITAITANGATWNIAFAEPLKNRYPSTYPLYNPGSSGGPPQSGPATIYAYTVEWDLDLTVNSAGVSFSRNSGADLIYVKVRSCTVNGGSVSGEPITPSAEEYLAFNGGFTNGTGSCEFDKMFNRVVSAGSTWHQVKFQSGVGDVTLTGDTIGANIDGLPRRLTMSNCTAGGSLQMGPLAYGFTEYLNITNSDIEGPLLGPSLDDSLSNWTWMGGGVFRQVTPSTPTRLATPGSWAFFSGSRSWGVPFQVLDAWQDPTYVYVQTTLSQFPSFSGTIFPTPTGFNIIPCLQAYGSGINSRSSDILALNNAPQGRPWLEYNERTFSGPQNGATAVNLPVSGNIVKIVVDVQRAYTGAQLTCNLLIDQFGVFLVKNIAGVYTETRPAGYYVNIRQPGLRTITPAGVSNAQPDDNLVAYEGWVMQQFQPIITTDTTGDPDPTKQAIVRFQVFADQGVTFPSSQADILLGQICL